MVDGKNTEDISDNAPKWIIKALGILENIATRTYEELEGDESMPACFGAITPEPKADDGFAWGVLRIPEELDKYEAYEHFRGALRYLQTTGDRHVLGGFTINEGWELDPNAGNKRTGRELVILNVESPDGWRATKLLTIIRGEDEISLEPAMTQINFHFPGEADGRMQGMFDEPELTPQ